MCWRFFLVVITWQSKKLIFSRNRNFILLSKIDNFTSFFLVIFWIFFFKIVKSKFIFFWKINNFSYFLSLFQASTETGERMQMLALAEGAVPVHLLTALFTKSDRNQELMKRQLSRHLIGKNSCWILIQISI